MGGERYGSIFITTDPNELNPELASIGWLWINPETGEIKKWTGSDWEVVPVTYSKIEVEHLELTDRLEVPGGDGLDVEFETGGFTYKFSKGVLVEREAD